MDKRIRSQVAVLEIDNGLFPIYEGVNTIGRNRQAVVNIKHVTISQNHAVIVTLNGQHFISDLDSSNGSFLRDLKMIPFKLYQLESNTEFILGGLPGVYMSEGKFSAEDKPLLGLDATQSLYGCNTQLLEYSVPQSTDIHDAATQEISWTAVKNSKKPVQNLGFQQAIDYHHSNPPEFKGKLLDTSDDFNDENLPLLENNERYTEVETNSKFNEITEIREKQVVELSKSAHKNPLKDDEGVCSLPKSDEGVEHVTKLEILRNFAHDDGKIPHKDILEDDESTDCEDDGGKFESGSPLPKSANNLVRSENLREYDNDDSKDSVEFTNFDKHPEKNVTEIGSKGSLDTENIASKRPKKSTMVISTQDLDEEAMDIVKVQSESGIKHNGCDSGSETETELIGSSAFQDTLPSSQNQSLFDLNDSDFVQATQEPHKHLSNAFHDKNKNRASSEESFRLGLTEIMIEPSQSVNTYEQVKQKNTVLGDGIFENTDNYESPLKKTLSNGNEQCSNSKIGDNRAPPIVADTTQDIFLIPTQVVNKSTQKIDSLVCVIDSTKTCTNSCKAAQKLVTVNEDIEFATKHASEKNYLEFEESKHLRSITDNYDIYGAPTQKCFEVNHANKVVQESLVTEADISERALRNFNPEIQKHNNIYTQVPISSVDTELKDGRKIQDGDDSISSERIDLEYDEITRGSIGEKCIEGQSKRKKVSLAKYRKSPKCAQSIQIYQLLENKESDNNGSQNEINSDDKTLNFSSVDANKSVAILVSKVTKVKKRRKSSDIKITVPRTRRTMSISKTESSVPCSFETKGEQKHGSNLNTSGNTDTCSSGSRNISKQTRKSKRQSQVPELKPNKLNRRGVLNSNDKSVNSSSHCVSTRNAKSLNLTEPAAKKSARLTASPVPISSNISEDLNKNIQPNIIDDPVQTPVVGISESKMLKKRKNPMVGTSDVPAESNPSASKLRRHNVADALPCVSPRGLRKQKPKVVFTMMESPQLESLIKQLGGSIVQSVEACTVLVTQHVKRSQKLLSAIGLGRHICSPKWITDSKKSQEFADPSDYILRDPEAEKKWNFSLDESLNRSRACKLLQPYSFYIQVTNGADVLKAAIESCGGKCLTKIPSTPIEEAYIISSPGNQSKYKKILRKYPYFRVIEAEAIFDGVLRQELRFYKHILE